jgi:hypothetical protein
MTLLTQTLLAFVGCHFMALSLPATGHMRLLSSNSYLVIASCVELNFVAPVSRIR